MLMMMMMTRMENVKTKKRKMFFFFFSYFTYLGMTIPLVPAAVFRFLFSRQCSIGSAFWLENSEYRI